MNPNAPPATARQVLRSARGVAASRAPGVPSPCVSVCTMNAASGLCDGCFRTLDDIAAWSRLDDAAKREVWQRVAERASRSLQSAESL